MKTADNVKVVNGVEVCRLIASGKINIFPSFQRHEKPSKGLRVSMRHSAERGMLCFLVPLRSGDAGDAAQRIQVLQEWNEQEEKELLEATVVVLAEYVSYTKAAFIDLYFHLNKHAKPASAGDLLKGYGHLIDPTLRKFVSGSRFTNEWKPFGRRNGHYEWAVAAAYEVDDLGARGSELVQILLSANEPTAIPEETVNRLTAMYETALAMRVAGAKGCLSKASLALIYRAMDQIKGIDAKVLALGFNYHKKHYFNPREKNRVREVEPTNAKIRDFLTAVKGMRLEVRAAKAAA